MVANRVPCIAVIVLCLAATSAGSVAHLKVFTPAPPKPVLSPVYTSDAWQIQSANATHITKFNYKIYSDYSDPNNKKFRIDQLAIPSMNFPEYDRYALNDLVYQDYPGFICQRLRSTWGSSWDSLDNATYAGSYEYEHGLFCNIWVFTRDLEQIRLLNNLKSEGNPASYCCDKNTPIFASITVKGYTGTIYFATYTPTVADQSVFTPPNYCKHELHLNQKNRPSELEEMSFFNML